jgi:hypothetical protein
VRKRLIHIEAVGQFAILAVRPIWNGFLNFRHDNPLSSGDGILTLLTSSRVALAHDPGIDGII